MSQPRNEHALSGNAEKVNCWEFKECGREPGGTNVTAFGLCPAATIKSMNGINGGVNGGRICWLVSGTYGKPKASFADCIAAKKLHSCYECEFHRKVLEEEGFPVAGSRIGTAVMRKNPLVSI